MRVVAYVDAFLIIGRDKRLLKKAIGLVSQRFSLEELRDASELVGIALIYNEKKRTLSLN